MAGNILLLQKYFMQQPVSGAIFPCNNCDRTQRVPHGALTRSQTGTTGAMEGGVDPDHSIAAPHLPEIS